MVKKSIAIIVFVLVSMGFLFGFITYNRRLSAMLDKEIAPQTVLLPEKPESPGVAADEPEEAYPDAPEAEETKDPQDEEAPLVIIPYIIGLHQDDAVKVLEEHELVPDVHLEYVDGVEKEFVFYQRPPKNQEVPAGTAVSFSVSRGPYGSSESVQMTVVPSVTGRSRTQAEEMLKSASLLIRVTEIHSTGTAKGMVISQDTSPGKEVAEGSTVTITVSLGKEASVQVTVPDVTGLMQSQATAKLEGAGLKAGILLIENSAAEGTVVSQSVSSGTKAEPGTTIEISVSKGPAEEPVEEEPGEEEPDPEEPHEEDPGPGEEDPDTTTNG